MEKTMIKIKAIYPGEGKKPLVIISEAGHRFYTWDKYPELPEAGDFITIKYEQEEGPAGQYNGKPQYKMLAIGIKEGPAPTRTLKPIAQAGDEVEQGRIDRVRARIRAAKQLVASEFGISEKDINPESMVLYETLRQLYGEHWLEGGKA